MEQATNPSVSYEQYIVVVRERDNLKKRLLRVNELISAVREQTRISDMETKELDNILKLLKSSS